MLTDRMRVELSIPAVLLFRVVQGATKIDTGEDTLSQLQLAVMAPIIDIPFAKQVGTLARRVERACDPILSHLDGCDAAEALLAILYWLKGVLDAEKLHLVEGSALDSAVGDVLGVLNRDEQRWGDVEAKAVEQAVWIEKHLNGLGYFN